MAPWLAHTWHVTDTSPAESGGAHIKALIGQDDPDICLNATYEHRIDHPDGYNFCLVPNEASDGVVFVAIAILLACILKGKFNMLMVLLAGMFLEVFVYYFNTGMFGNSFSLWLGIQPADVFLYVFLPALLLESACRLDFFIFKKLSVQIMILAFLCVIINTVLMTPIMLIGLDLSANGWNWQHAVLFSVMIASTDAVSVTAVLHAAGAPEGLVVLLEGESLFNDATSIVLFEIFFEKVNQLDMGEATQSNILAELPSILWQITWLSGGGIVIGLLFGYMTQATLRYLRRGGLMPKAEISLVLGMAYMCYYVANAPCKVSGVIAVVVMGLQGGSCGKWDMSAKILESGQFEHFWDILGFVLNGVVFFFAGVASVNFLLRSSGVIFTLGVWPMLQFFSLLPLIYLAILTVRIIGMTLVNPLLKAMGSPLTMKNIVFSTAGGLRGALCLILVQNLIQSNIRLGDHVDKQVLEVRGEMALWASGFVLMTLLINAPLLGPLLNYLKLTEISPARKLMRAKAKRALERFTRTAIDELRDEKDEMLRGTDWDMVEEYVTGEEADQESSEGSENVAEVSSGLGFHRNGLDRQHSRKVAGNAKGRGRGSVRRGLNQPLLASMEEDESDTDESASLETIHASVGAPRLPLGQMMDDEEIIDDSDAVFQDFRRTGKMENVHSARLSTDGWRPPQRSTPPGTPPQRSASGTGQGAFGSPVVPAASSSSSSTDPPPGGPPPPPLEVSEEVSSPSAFCDVNIAEDVRTVKEESFADSDDDDEAQHPAAKSMMSDAPARSLLVKTSSFQKRSRPSMSIERPSAVKFAPEVTETSAESSSGASSAALPPPMPTTTTATEEEEEEERSGGSHARSLHTALSHKISLFLGNSESLDEEEEGEEEEEEEGAADEASPFRRSKSSNGEPSEGDPRHPSSSAGNLAGREITRHLSDLSENKELPMRSARSAGDLLIHRGSPDGAAEAAQLLEAAGAPGDVEICDLNVEEKMSEARIRLIVGLKRYFHGKRTEGLLSAHGLRILNEAVDLSLERPHRKLAMWKIAEKEACGKFTTRWMSLLSFKLRTFPMWKHKIPLLHDFIHRNFLVPVIKLLNWRMGYTMTLACEVSIEYWLSLRHSPNAAWLSASAPELLEEIEEEMDRAWQFIVDREVEAPERFKMVQSYRAAMAIMRQQEFFLGKLYKTGLLDESEMHHLEGEVSDRQGKLEEQGPGWKQPALNQIIRGLPFFSNIAEDAYQWIKRHAFLMRYDEGTLVIEQQNDGNGMFIVVTGLVESKYKQVMESFNNVWMVGTGGVVGLVAALTKSKVPGAADVVARGNPLGKGPVLMHIPQHVVDEIRKRAANGSRQFKQLEINLFRLAALNIVERLRPLLVEQICQNMVKNEKKAAKASLKSKSRWAKIKKKVVPDNYAFPVSAGAAAMQENFKTAAQLQSAAHRMLDTICLDFQDGYLLDLKGGAVFTLHCTCVLIGGDLQGPISSTNAKQPLSVVRGPYMFIRNHEIGDNKPTKYVVGPKGAAIVVAGLPDEKALEASHQGNKAPMASSNLKAVVAPH